MKGSNRDWHSEQLDSPGTGQIKHCSGIVCNGQRSKAFELTTTTVQLLVGGGFVQFDSWLPAELRMN